MTDGKAERVLRCGNCSADVTFSSPGTLVVVCPHCSWSSYRTDVDLETIGKVAQPAALASRFQIGTSGEHRGLPFTVRGQLQLDHGAGLWNEWAAEDSEGEWFWIAEAQGNLLIFREVENPKGLGELDRSQLSPGRQVNLSGKRWYVSEVGEGAVVAAAGEHPIRIEDGEVTSYVDLQSGELRVATLDFTRAGEPELLTGERVGAEELGLDPLTQPENGPDSVASRRIDCSQCGGEIELLDPEHAVRVGCPSCGAVLDATSTKARALAEAREIKDRPSIPLGTTGELDGEAFQVLGFMERRVRAEGRWWPWREYLLRTSEGGYRWLVEDSGHWLYVTPVPYSVVQGGRYEGQPFKHFTSGKAEVHWVVGEFYWQVQAGDTVRATDYTAPPLSISTEETDSEISASMGRYVDPGELEAAFDGPVDLPPQSGVGMAQPNPARPKTDWKLYCLLAALVIALRVFIGSNHENRIVYSAEHGPTPSEQDKMSEGEFSDEFELTADPANIRVRIEVPGLAQGWIGVSGALVNMETGKVITFDTAAQHYTGVSDGERWTEGNRRGSAMIGSVPAGTYSLRIASMGYEAGCGRPFSLEVTSQVPRVLWLLLALLLPLLIPILATLRAWAFESKRWKNSDHPWGEG